MKKALCSLLIVAILMNFIISSICYAETDGTEGIGGVGDYMIGDGTENKSAIPSNTTATEIIEDGNASGSSMDFLAAGRTMVGVVMGYLALIVDIIPLQFQLILSVMSMTNIYSADGTEFKDFDFWLTIDRMVFNRVALLNANYFDSDNKYTLGTGDNEITIDTTGSPTLLIKESITEMFMICRILAIIISLLVLIYIGIRMAFSTIASEQAKYKHMLFSWVESIAIMFCLIYIMAIILNLGEMLNSVFYNIRCSLVAADEKGFETVILDTMLSSILDASGLTLALYSIIYWILVFCQVRFFYLYIKRMLMIGFLIMISPLITVTYSIDKAGDGKAQALSIWLQEFLVNVLIQPLHALIYLVFMFTAGEIAKFAPVLAVAFMLALGNVEKMVKVIFNIKDIVSLGGINDFLKKGKK